MLSFSEEWSIIVLSIQIASIAIAIMTIPALVTAWYIARRRSVFTFVIENVAQVPLVLPPVVTGLLLLIFLGPKGAGGRLIDYLFGLDLAFTSTGAAIAAGIMAFPLLVQTFRIAIEHIDPEWEEAASVDGGSKWAVFRWVTFPLAAKGIMAGIILGFARAIGEFGATIVFAGNIPDRTQTIPLAVFTQLGQVGTESSMIRLVLVAVSLSVFSLSVHAYLSSRLTRT